MRWKFKAFTFSIIQLIYFDKRYRFREISGGSEIASNDSRRPLSSAGHFNWFAARGNMSADSDISAQMYVNMFFFANNVEKFLFFFFFHFNQETSLPEVCCF